MTCDSWCFRFDNKTVLLHFLFQMDRNLEKKKKLPRVLFPSSKFPDSLDCWQEDWPMSWSIQVIHLLSSKCTPLDPLLSLIPHIQAHLISSSFLPVALVKHSYQTQLGSVNNFFWPLLPGHNPSLIKVRSGTQASNLKGRAMEEWPVASSYGLLAYRLTLGQSYPVVQDYLPKVWCNPLWAQPSYTS